MLRESLLILEELEDLELIEIYAYAAAYPDAAHVHTHVHADADGTVRMSFDGTGAIIP